MRRREFIKLLGATASGWPSSIAAQPKVPTVALARSTFLFGATHLVKAFQEGLREQGFEDGQNVRIALRSGEGSRDRLREVVSELVEAQVDVIAGNDFAARTAAAKTASIPVIFVTGGDPVAGNLVQNLNRPIRNVTGVSFYAADLTPKRLELAHQLIPGGDLIGVLLDSALSTIKDVTRNVLAAAAALGREPVVMEVASEHEFEAAFAELARKRIGVVCVGSGALLIDREEIIMALTERHHIPAIYPKRESVEAGGLMSYGASQPDAYRQAGIYAGRILKGEKPADLPVLLPTKFELVINLKTAKALGLTIPPTLLARADEVIE